MTLRSILGDRKAPVVVRRCLRALRHPRQHYHRHEGVAAGRLHVLYELDRVPVGIRRTKPAGREVFEEIIAVRVVSLRLPVVGRCCIASPAHHRQAAVCHRGRIFWIRATIDIWADCVPVAQHIHRNVNRCRSVRSRGSLGRIATLPAVIDCGDNVIVRRAVR